MGSEKIRFTSEIKVEVVQQCGTDELIAHAAWVSTQRPYAADARVAGLIGTLMKNRHGTPFEHGSLTVRVHAPICVWREWHRHRVGMALHEDGLDWSFNEESGRYKDLEPLFYVPPRDRPMIRPEGFKSMRPGFDTATDEDYAAIVTHLESGYRHAYDHYQSLLALQCDRGLARDVLGVGIYSACYCTCNPRSLMAFLELRTDHPEAKRPSKPLYEIRVAADKLETIFAEHWPITHAAWVKHGRMAP